MYAIRNRLNAIRRALQHLNGILASQLESVFVHSRRTAFLSSYQSEIGTTCPRHWPKHFILRGGNTASLAKLNPTTQILGPNTKLRVATRSEAAFDLKQRRLNKTSIPSKRGRMGSRGVSSFTIYVPHI